MPLRADARARWPLLRMRYVRVDGHECMGITGKTECAKDGLTFND